MFIAYTDASVKAEAAYIGFIVEFEDGNVIRRRIVTTETDNNKAEALALFELTSFLQYYGLSRGVVLFDSKSVKRWLNNRGSKVHRKILQKVRNSLKKLEVRTQIIPRKINIAHRISYSGDYQSSTPVSTMNRYLYGNMESYPDFYLSLSAYEGYKRITGHKDRTFHHAQRKLNMNIWLGELVRVSNNVEEYAFYDLRIKVFEDCIISIRRTNYVEMQHHWTAIKKRRKLKSLINKSIV
jgi:ribonuclease HI